MVLSAAKDLVTIAEPDILQAMQAFMLGSTGFVGWSACLLMALVWLLCMLAAWMLSPVLDGLSLGEATAISLGLPLPLQAMLSIVAGMVVFNIASLLRWRTRRGVHDVELFIGLLIDVAALTAQLYLSGGIGNPFVFLYLLQIAVGAMLLRGGYIWSIVVVASACVMLLSRHSQPLRRLPFGVSATRAQLTRRIGRRGLTGLFS